MVSQNKMPRCPNCSYILVLLEKRAKYKCAKCGKLFLQKEIDDKEFREYNKREKEKEKDDFQKNLKLRRKRLKPRRNIQSQAIKQKKLHEYQIRHYQENKDLYKKINALNYIKHKNSILNKARERYKLNTEAILKRNKNWRLNNLGKVKLSKEKYRKINIEETRLNQRIIDWRQAQRGLILFLIGDYHNMF